MDRPETPVTFGTNGGLVGIVTQPNSTRASIGCLLLNTGVNHHIGPRRFNVKVARAVAKLGIPSLRFDLSGIGDSRGSSGQHDFREQAIFDMRMALDQLTASTGVKEFIVFGNCSGAENALALSLVDPRVIGLCMFDGYTYLTKGVRIERKLRRWLAFPFNASIRRQFSWWKDWLTWLDSPSDPETRKKVLDRILRRSAPGNTSETGIFEVDSPDYRADDYERDMNKLAERGVDLYVMFSNSITATDRDRDLLSAIRHAPFQNRTRYQFWPDVDHTITSLVAQRKMLDALCSWASSVVAAGLPNQVDARAALRAASAGELAPRGMASAVRT